MPKEDRLNLEGLKKEVYMAQLKNGCLLFIKAIGGSMHPILKDGDLVIIKYLSPKKMKIGDIIVYKRQGESNIVVHRLVRKDEYNGKLYLGTKGDNALYRGYDSFICEEDVLGKVVMRKRDGKITSLEGYLVCVMGYIYARFLLYSPTSLRFLRKVLKGMKKCLVKES